MKYRYAILTALLSIGILAGTVAQAQLPNQQEQKKRDSIVASAGAADATVGMSAAALKNKAEVTAGDSAAAAAFSSFKLLEDNFGIPPKKEKSNPTNKPVKEPAKPWALSQHQKDYAQVGTLCTGKVRGGSRTAKKAARVAKRCFKTGIDLFEQMRRVEAMPQLLTTYSVYPDNLLVNVLLGHCYVANVTTRLYADTFLNAALRLNPDCYEALYDKARVMVSKYQLDEAIATFEKCMKLPTADTTVKLRCQQRIRECKYAKVQMKKPQRVFIDNLGSSLNSVYPDYAPIVLSDEEQIYFTSLRPGAVTEDLDTYTGMAFEDIYIARLDTVTDTLWYVENVGKPVNTAGHDASAGISPDEATLYVYRGIKNEGDIYTAQMGDETWEKPKRKEEGREAGAKNSHEAVMSYTFDGNTAYFVSNRAGGYGGFDIWMMKKSGNNWGDPVNLGPKVNTAKDELCVWAVPDGNSIFFSSNGHLGMGGFDIFYSKKDGSDTSWTYPMNVGHPVNSVENDMFYRRSLSGKTAYYASERMYYHETPTQMNSIGYGGYDIYKITYMGEEKGVITQGEDQLLAYITKPVSESVSEAAAEIQITPITLLKGFVFDDYTKEPLGADVVMVDNDLQQEIAVFQSNARTGRFMIQLPAGHNYGITVRKPGYLFHSENFDIPVTADYQEVYKEFPLKNVSVGSRVVLRNIFFAFDKSDLLPQSFVELDRLYKLMVDVPGIKIEISGHTDSKGSATYNQKLSERRAKAVVDYLVEKGLPIERLTFAGYGMMQPIATNETEEGRALNRRTEFKIIENAEEEAENARQGRRQPQQSVEVATPDASDVQNTLESVTGTPANPLPEAQ